MQSCFYHVRGTYRQAARRALEARFHVVRPQDRQGEVRGWKLFCMLPGGPGGWTHEHMRVLLDDADTFNLFFEAAFQCEIAEVLMGARLTALAKPNGRQDICETICARVREGMRTISTRIVDQGWDG